MYSKLKLGAFAIASLALAAGAQAQSLGVAAGAQGSNNFANNSAIGKILIEEGGMDTRVQSYGGTGAYLPIMNQGEIDIAAVTLPDAEEAHAGTGTFKGRALDNIRLIGIISVTPVGFMVKDDSDIKSIADLRDKRVTHGFVSQSQVLTNVDGLLANGGLTPDDIDKVMVQSVGRSVDALIAGNADAAFFALRGGKAKEANASLGGIRWLPLSDDPEAIARMKDVLGSSYYLEINPEPGLPGIPETIGAMALDQSLVAGAHVSDDLIYQVTKTLYENPETVAVAARGLGEFDPAKMAKNDSTVPFHPGAIKYFKEIGVWKE